MPAGRASSIRVDAHEYADVTSRAREFDPLLDKALKKALREAAKIGADAAKDRIRMMPSTGGHLRHGTASRPSGLRTKIAANIRTTADGRDVRIVQGIAGISGRSARGLLRRIDDGGRFRHPVFGNRRVWASQQGWSYFIRPIEAKRPEMEAKVSDALDRTLAVIAGRL